MSQIFSSTVHATIAERSYAECAASTASSTVISCRDHPARTGAAKNHSAIVVWTVIDLCDVKHPRYIGQM